MEWHESQAGGVRIYHLKGEIDLHVSPELRKILQTHLHERTPLVILDLTGVAYMDSSGVATVVEYCADARAFEGQLALAGVNEHLHSILKLMRLDKCLAIHPTLADAMPAPAEAGSDAPKN